MRILGIDHVAVCCGDLDATAAPFLDLLGLAVGPRELVETQKTEAYFLLTGDEAGACVELIEPKGNAGLSKFLEKRGTGLHHVAFLVDDLAAALRELDERRATQASASSALSGSASHAEFSAPEPTTSRAMRRATSRLIPGSCPS